MLIQIGACNPLHPGKLIIYDARSYINAQANKLNKGGFENVNDFYTNCQIEFLEIDNIHGVRGAIQKVYEMSQSYEQSILNGSRFLS